MRISAEGLEFPTSPWGRYRPRRGMRVVLSATRALAVPVFKQVALLLRRIVRGRLSFVDVELWGLRLRLAAHGNISEGRLIFIPGSWDRVERKALAEHLAPGAVFVDVGANAGGYTWWVLSRLKQECTIVAIEPDPALVAALRFNLAMNDADNVLVEPVAVGGDTGAGMLRIDLINRGENRLVTEGGGSAGAISIPVRPLAAILLSHGVTRVDGLKIDIEGLELAVLRAFFRDAPRGLWPKLLITEHRRTSVHDEMQKLLLQSGYQIMHRTKLNLLCRLS